MTELEHLKKILKKHNISYKQVAEIVGMTHNSIRHALKPSGELPKWLKLLLFIDKKNEL